MEIPPLSFSTPISRPRMNELSYYPSSSTEKCDNEYQAWIEVSHSSCVGPLDCCSASSDNRVVTTTAPQGYPSYAGFPSGHTSTAKLEGYAAPSRHGSGLDGVHDEIVVVDDDQLGDLDEYSAHSLRDAISSLGRSVTHRLLSSSSLARDRSPSPLSVRPPIKRDRSEIGKKQRCLVCETLTSGFHFGAVSCAACSAFFRRTVAERREYTCRAEGENHLKCEINAEQRCYCRACRLQKCLRVGMDPLAVQPHRDQIGAKRKISESGSGSRRGSSSPSALVSTQRNGDSSASRQNLSLAEHLTFNRRIQEVLSGTMQNSQPEVAPKKASATAALLTNQNAFAEQLLAFSRTPVISKSEQSGAERAVPSTSHSGASVIENGVVSSSSGHGSGQVVHEMKPPIIPDDGTEEEFIVYEYEDDLGRDERMELRERHTHLGYERQSVPSGSRFDSRHVSISNENLIEILVAAYEQLNERRRLLYCPDTMRDILGGTQPVARPALLGERMQKQRLRQEVGLVAEFLSVLSPFTSLDLDDKIALFKALSCPYSILEKHYVTMRRGGLQQNRIVHNDNSYTDLSDSALENVRMEGSREDHAQCDKETLKKLFIDPLRESLQAVTGAMYNMKMTDVEFCALIAVILFDPSTAGLSDATRAQVRAARDRVYHDWFAFYRSKGLQEPDSCQRVGNTMLLLQAVQATADKTQENYHIVRVFDLFEYDKILDEMMGN